MRKNLRIKAFAVLMVLLLSGAMAISASAAIQASYYLDSYSASADNGTGSQVIIYFDVNATRVMDTVGASYIIVQEYKNGTWIGVGPYFGSTSNGMLAEDADANMGSITYSGTSGMRYRAQVTVYAANSSGSDSRTVTTNTVTAG